MKKKSGNMKRIGMLGLWLVAMCLPALADDFTFASRVLDFVKAGRGDSICALLHPALAPQVKPETFDATFAQLTAMFGPLGAEGEWTTEQVQGNRRDSRRLTFGQTPLLFVLTTDSASRILSINIVPAPAEPAPAAATDSFTEREVTVENGVVRLPGTLCLPAGTEDPVPVVVLVHGSGPNDRDETLGPNKPFRELAHRLAARGIATLRYDKRTRVYSSSLRDVFPTLNYDTEVVDDACAAVKLAAAQPEADPARVFVLGHSLGGSLVPRIARRSAVPVAGVVAMSGLARTIDVAIREQLRYVMHEVEGLPLDSAEAACHELLSTMPESYLQAARQYDAPAEARAMKCPVLVLQGGHDYQVTRADYDLWQQALQGRDDATFVWLPECDHLMRALPAMAKPADYMRALPMSEEAVTAIADFVLAH